MDKAVLDGYDRAFRQNLDQLIQRTHDPSLRKTFSDMRECPLKDGSGHCRSWADYILSALIRHSCYQRVDLEDALQYIVFRMLARVGERGLARRSLFDFDENRPYDLSVGNPLQAIFRAYLQNDLRSVCAGKISRLKTTNRPQGTLSIGQRNDDQGATITADEIPDRTTPHERRTVQRHR